MGKLVCVVDDDALVRETIVLHLQHLGFDTIETGDGGEVADLVADPKVDALVVDVRMPGKDGFAVIKEVRERRDDLRIVAISGGGGGVAPSQYLHFASLLGVDAYLTKPFGSDDLKAALGQA